MNPTNVGAIIRSAAALGMDAVLLTPGCSDPLYRRAARVSMGTVFQIKWTFMENSDLERIKAMGFKTVAMALKDNSLSIRDPALTSEEKLAIVMGTEGDGLSDVTIAECDYTVKIPMYYGVDSLNVAAASAIAFYQLGNKTNKL
jgi:tRNA G18 (ribose-2'-O)-methylase SpoU